MDELPAPRCPGCYARNVVILAQRAKIRRLQNEVKRLEARIKAARAVGQDINRQADEVLNGHAPRGEWSFALGAGRTAKAILSRLG